MSVLVTAFVADSEALCKVSSYEPPRLASGDWVALYGQGRVGALQNAAPSVLCTAGHSPNRTSTNYHGTGYQEEEEKEEEEEEEEEDEEEEEVTITPHDSEVR